MTRWFSLTDAPLTLHGFAVKEKGKFYRLPESIIDKVNPGVTALANDAAGCRIRFRTDSPTIDLRYVPVKFPLASANLGIVGRSCADCYVDGVFRGNRPPNLDVAIMEVTIRKEPIRQNVVINLPSFNNIRDFEVGIADGAAMEAPLPYAIARPIVFYGSSITHGAAASRPGVAYPAQVARALDADYINLGFAGACRGEPIMANYIASLDMSLFVLDYDHNAPNVEHLQATHEPFYQVIRAAQPELPIVLISKPDFDANRTENARRRAVIQATYDRARAAGDRMIWFIDGETLFGTVDRDACTVDGCHPNDLGFYRMAQTITPVLREILSSKD